MRGRLDDEKLETLRGWGAGLAADGRDEFRAAGKAILILIEEIERLQVDVWHAQDESAGPSTSARSAVVEESRPATGPEGVAESGQPGGLESTLRGRVRRLLNRGRLENG